MTQILYEYQYGEERRSVFSGQQGNAYQYGGRFAVIAVQEVMHWVSHYYFKEEFHGEVYKISPDFHERISNFWSRIPGSQLPHLTPSKDSQLFPSKVLNVSQIALGPLNNNFVEHLNI